MKQLELMLEAAREAYTAALRGKGRSALAVSSGSRLHVLEQERLSLARHSYC